ncbi:tetratricopeptide repeat protein [Candidatus Thiodictyon syntrophicum]|uniref:Tetratricopeptide repeat protein n=1 Tax=Candidatus Thiodictyon syntrophicum TaxID=1166950 RepID=A0A2K8U9N7_9GAMM|nr:tetratricopeptide repeat protein [Candidatus Thiodictyon syntrophicum]AUB82308.1 hypothetical protein THSYN_16035 [Candidatus Thiodictyon syntrophicum]
MDAIPRPPLALTLVLLILLAPWPVPAAERLLHGLVQTVGTQGDLNPAPAVDVALVQTGRTATTDSLGVFLLELTAAQVAGRQVQLLVRKDGWVIDHPLEGRVDIPDDLAARVVELRLLPKGSKRLRTDERIESLITELHEKAAAAIKDRLPEQGAGVGKTPSPPPDVAALIADWSGRYGFGPAEVQGQIDRWVAQTEARADDPWRLGLAAYARKNFADAFSRGMESGDAYAGRLAANRTREQDLLEKTLRGYRLAGDAAGTGYRFDEALDAYGKGLAAVRKEESPRSWAEMTVLVADAHQELGIRLGGTESRRHLAAAVVAYQEALGVYTRAELPLEWAMTQNNLGVALKEQGIRADGDAGRRLLAAAVAAFREALGVQSRAELPQQWAATQNNLGVALLAQGTRTDGEEGWRLLAESVATSREALGVCTRTDGEEGRRLLAEAVASYREALGVYARAALPQDWAMTQNNLGRALQQQGSRTGGEEGRRLLAVAIAAYREALTVFTLEHMAPQWALTQQNLLRACATLEDARGMAGVLKDLLRADPDDADLYNAAQTLYHEKLFDFAAAYHLTAAWLQRHPDKLSARMNFAETHLTTGRLPEARDRLAALIALADPAQRPEPATESALRLLEIAALAGLADPQSSAALPGRLADLRALVAAQPADFKPGWTFAGTGHYIETAPAFAPSRAALLALIRAAGEGRDALLAAIDSAGGALTGAAGR